MSTNWAEATTNVFTALERMLSAIMSGQNAYIAVMKNADVKHPITIPNPELDNIFNWTCSHGTVTPQKLKRDFFNDTEKDLYYNYTTLFLSKEVRDKYIETGELDKVEYMGRATPVKVKDATAARTDGYEYQGRCYSWKPVGNMPYRIPDPSIKNVYVVVTDHESVKTVKEVRAKIAEAMAMDL